jgi:hemerythrin-like domain-containing protein
MACFFYHAICDFFIYDRIFSMPYFWGIGSGVLNFVKGISDGIVALKKGKSEAIQLVYENLSGYATLLENHISKENNILFRMADQMFSADEQQTLIEHFAVVESGADPEFNAENSVAKINFLASIYIQ